MISFDFEELNKLYPDIEIQFEKDYVLGLNRIRIADSTHTYTFAFVIPFEAPEEALSDKIKEGVVEVRKYLDQSKNM